MEESVSCRGPCKRKDWPISGRSSFFNHISRSSQCRALYSETEFLELQRLSKERRKVNELKSKKVKKKQKEKEPTTSDKNLDPKKNSKLAPGFSEWFNGETRAHWKRPCFNGFQTVVMGDSQLKIYGQNNKRRAGFSITSYSGCDVSAKTRL